METVLTKTTSTDDLSQILPYEEQAFKEGAARLLDSPVLPFIIKSFFKDVSLADVKQWAKKVENVEDFQRIFVAPAVETILKKTSSEFEINGFGNLSKGSRYLFVSNHRDIIMDPTLFTYGCWREGFSTPKICLGDNLLGSQFITDMVKMNKGLIVKRNVVQKELMKWTKVLSRAINDEISQTDSVWIAQKEGRAKDGNDLTHPGILKMVALAGEGVFIEKISKLHIVPVAISYEFDPCDALKAKELFLTEKQGDYVKSEDEDKNSMSKGILDPKGKISITIGKEISDCLKKAKKLSSKAEQLRFICDEIDRQIHYNYRLYPSNFIAADEINKNDDNSSCYTEKEKKFFLERIKKQFSALNIPETTGMTEKFLSIYANPVKNRKESK